uniref:Uncharacterized protein n=1 Tax=Anopheles merus TaxID=30066 RepID=A0A182VJW2_ANOME
MEGCSGVGSQGSGPGAQDSRGPRTGPGTATELKRAAKKRTRLSHIKMHIPVCTTFEGRRKTKPPCVRQSFEMGLEASFALNGLHEPVSVQDCLVCRILFGASRRMEGLIDSVAQLIVHRFAARTEPIARLARFRARAGVHVRQRLARFLALAEVARIAQGAEPFAFERRHLGAVEMATVHVVPVDPNLFGRRVRDDGFEQQQR